MNIRNHFGVKYTPDDKNFILYNFKKWHRAVLFFCIDGLRSVVKVFLSGVYQKPDLPSKDLFERRYFRKPYPPARQEEKPMQRFSLADVLSEATFCYIVKEKVFEHGQCPSIQKTFLERSFWWIHFQNKCNKGIPQQRY